MKLIIDIPKELKQKIDEGFTNQVIINKLWDATRNSTPIPDNATNGDVIKILFADFMYIPWKEWLMIDLPWWNSPYQKDGKADCDTCEKAWTDECKRAECYEHNYKYYQKGGKE